MSLFFRQRPRPRVRLRRSFPLRVESLETRKFLAGDTFTTNEDSGLEIGAPGVLVGTVSFQQNQAAKLVVAQVNGSSSSVGIPIPLESGARLTIRADGGFVYDPAQADSIQRLTTGQQQVETFNYTVRDGSGKDEVATAMIVVQGVNDFPSAVDDLFSTDEDSLLTLSAPGVLGNDVDADGDTLTVTEYSTISLRGAKITIGANGLLAYDPREAAKLASLPAGATDDDSFDYIASDGHGGTDRAKVTLRVTGGNDAPVATTDAFATLNNAVVTGNLVTTNNGGGIDFDVDTGDSFTVARVNNQTADIGRAFALPSGARLTLNANGSFSYDPSTATAFAALRPNQFATDTFSYALTDGRATGAAAEVRIRVSGGTNRTPVAVNDTAQTSVGTSVSVSVLSNDTDPDEDTLSLLQVGPAQHGQTFNNFGRATYVPNDNFTGSDQFSYTVSDGFGGTATAQVSVTVSPGVVSATQYDFEAASFATVEGNATNTARVAQVRRSGNVVGSSSVDVVLAATTPVSATPGVDFTAGRITVTFAPGETVKTVPIEILGDTTNEPDESLALSLTNPSTGGQIGTTRPTSRLDITNDDGAALPGSISGVKWHDLDRDRRRDPNEPLLSGWTVFLDADGDGVRDPGEPFTQTDVNGSYSFTGLAPGSHTVAEENQPNWQQTFPTASIADAQSLATGILVRAVTSADFNGDGRADLAVVHEVAEGTPGHSEVVVLLNDDLVGFANRSHLSLGAGSHAHSIVATDLDGDGDIDLAIASVGDTTRAKDKGNALFVLLNQGQANFAKRVRYQAGNGPVDVAAADLDGDGRRELVVANSRSNTVSVFHNENNAGFRQTQKLVTGVKPSSVVLGDLDGDGDADLAVANAGSDDVSLFHNSGGQLQFHEKLAAGDSPADVIAADLDGDADLDLAVANYDGGSISVFLASAGSFLPQTPLTGYAGAVSLTAADLDGDGRVDLAVAKAEANRSVSILSGNGAGQFTSTVERSAGTSPWWIIAADVVGDARREIVVANLASGITILTNGSRASHRVTLGSGQSLVGIEFGNFLDDPTQL